MLRKLFITIALLGISATVLSNERIVTVTTLTDFPPYTFNKENAVEKLEEVIPPGKDSLQLQGYSWDVVRASLHEMGYTIKLLIAPWSRAMYYTKRGKADVIFPAIKTVEREKVFHYSKEPTDLTKIVIYIPVDVDFDFNNGFNSLIGLSIATVRGWAYGKKYEANNRIIKGTCDTVVGCFDMLDKKRVFGVIGYESAFDYRLKQEGIFNKYKKSPSLDSIADYLIGMKDKSHVVKIINDFDSGIRKIRQKGELDKIEQKWR